MNVEIAQVWQWLEQVPDPEIPVVSVVELGIVRDVGFDAGGECVVTITPTYSGCPAMITIADGIREVLASHGVARSRLETRLAPAWTTDWMTDAARAKLKDYGIAPPRQRADGYQAIDISALRHGAGADAPLPCPRCGSTHTRLVSRFGSTSCKALYVCQDCREPFDHFKSH
jgi:ring-1,2-phenylacetyl-CoA epoxidase subunit PaaD